MHPSNHFIRRALQAVCLVGISLATALPAIAAPITWGAPTDNTGELTDFSTNGTFHEGYSGDNVDITVDPGGLNLTFVSSSNLGNGVFGNADPALRTNADYDALLQNATWSGGDTQIELGTQLPLAVGVEYEVQIWLADTRGCCQNRQKTYGDGNGNQVVLNSGNGDGTDTDFVIGTFTADAATQVLTFTGGGATHPQYNAIMVRQIGVPADTDGDGLPDAWEEANGLDPDDNGENPNNNGVPGNPDNGADGDPDMDASPNSEEFGRNTDPQEPDTDMDGYYDGAETNSGTFISYDKATNTGDTGTDPKNDDTDNDNLLDGVETNTGTFVDANDTGTSPLLADSDSDTFDDDFEIERGSDPNDPASVPFFNPITWGDPQPVTGEVTDFNTEGELIHAWSGDNGDVIINSLGITFVPGPNLNNNVFGGADNGVAHPDADYDALLENATWGNVEQSITIDGLTDGQDYLIQLWMADTRTCCSGRMKTYDSGQGTPQVILDSGTPGVMPSQFVIGTFTADGETQDLRFVGGGGATHPQYNAIMVRTLVPATPLRVTEITFDGSDAVMTWSSIPNQDYRVWYSTDLRIWEELDDGVPSGGDETTYTDPLMTRLANLPEPQPVPPRAYYQIELVVE